MGAGLLATALFAATLAGSGRTALAAEQTQAGGDAGAQAATGDTGAQAAAGQAATGDAGTQAAAGGQGTTGDYWPSNVTISEPDGGETAIVMEEQTGTVLYEHNADDQHYPASITKVMTALIAIENSKLDETVTYSHNAVYGVEAGSSGIAREEGEQLTMEQCLLAMMLESCNSTAVAIAEHVGGSVDGFVKMMNEKAKELGCTNTHFSNPNGLPDETHVTSARDMALIAREAFKSDTFRRIVGTKSVFLPPTNKHAEQTPLNNHHAMLNYYHTSKFLYEYCLGGKTGYTTAARNTLVTYAEKDGMTLVCVVMNAGSRNHYVDTTNLFNYCFDNFVVQSVADQTGLFEKSADWDAGSLGGNMDPVSVDPKGLVVLPKTASFTDAKSQVIPQKDGSGKKGDIAGKIVYTYAGRPVGEADLLYAAEKKGSTYPFQNTAAASESEGSKYININLLYIIPGVLLAIGLFLIIRSVLKQTEKRRRFRDRTRERKPKKAPSYTKITRKNPRRTKRKKGHDLTSSNRNSDSFIKQ